MTTSATYTGDLLLSLNTEGDWDINYINGQAIMTDGFDSSVILSVFGEPDFWQNSLTDDPNEKYISEFPNIIKNGRVDDPTLKNGTAAIKKALQWMIDVLAAETINVIGEVLNIFGLAWQVEIIKGEIVSRYEVNWQKGVISVAGIPIFDAATIKPRRFNDLMLNPSLDEMLNPSGDTQLYEFT